MMASQPPRLAELFRRVKYDKSRTAICLSGAVSLFILRLLYISEFIYENSDIQKT